MRSLHDNNILKLLDMRIIFLILIVLIMAACQQKKTENVYEISGTVPADVTGLVYLQEYKDRKYINVDSTEIDNGKFTFSGSVTEPKMYALSQKGQRTQIFLDNYPMQLELTNEWEIAGLTGSENAELFHRVSPESAKGTLNPDSLLRLHPASPAAVYFLTRNIYRYDYSELKSIKESLSDSLNDHSYVKEIEENLRALENVQPGKPAPDFTLTTPEGDTFSLSSLRGKYVLIDFWASWCPDCRKANPLLVELYNEFKNKDFTILGVSIDEDKERWLTAIEKDGLTWAQVITEGGWNSEVAKVYAIRWLPTSFLIDPDGIIVSKSIDTQKTIESVKEILN